MLEAQILYAMGIKPKWDEGGRVVGMEVIPQRDLGRPRIDPIISLTGLYRDQFPNVMERFNEAIVMLAKLDESDSVNLVRANTARIKSKLIEQGVKPDVAEEFALTRVFGNESGDYSTRLTNASLASDQWGRRRRQTGEALSVSHVVGLRAEHGQLEPEADRRHWTGNQCVCGTPQGDECRCVFAFLQPAGAYWIPTTRSSIWAAFPWP